MVPHCAASCIAVMTILLLNLQLHCTSSIYRQWNSSVTRGNQTLRCHSRTKQAFFFKWLFTNSTTLKHNVQLCICKQKCVTNECIQIGGNQRRVSWKMHFATRQRELILTALDTKLYMTNGQLKDKIISPVKTMVLSHTTGTFSLH